MKSITTILIWALVLTTVGLAQANEKQPKPNTINVHLNFNLLDEKSQPLLITNKDHFTVYENNIPQQITFLDTQKDAVSYMLLLDTSGSMRDHWTAINSLARLLITSLSEKDEMSTGQIKQNAELLADFTNNKARLQDSLQELYMGGISLLLDGIADGAKYLKAKGKSSRRTVILISDGLETKNPTKPIQVSDQLGKDDVQVIVVIFPNERFISPSDLAKRDVKTIVKSYPTLNAIASASGGKLIPIYGTQDFEEAVKEITDLTKATYRLGYTSTNIEGRGKLRKVRIEAKSPDGKTITRNDSYTPVK